MWKYLLLLFPSFCFAQGTQTVTVATDPPTCNTGMIYTNSGTNSLKLCGPANTWANAGSSGGQFTAAAYGAVYDDATDNCTAFQNLTAAAAAYAGPGIPSISFAPPAGASGKAYKIVACNVIFTVPADIEGYGAVFDCQQSASFSNCVQLGPTGLSNFSNAQTPPYRFQDFTFQGGCVNVTIACIQSPVFVSNPQILRVHAANVGAGNASPPACTNYFISFDGHNNAPQIIDNEYWDTDATTGRCWSINNRTSAGGGTNSALIAHNTVIGAGAATGFTTPCGSVGHSELGAASIIQGNQFYGFGQGVLLLNPQTNTQIIGGNQFDQAGCTTGVVSADIQYGNGSNLAVNGVTITGNYFGVHATGLISVATGSTSVISNLIISGNQVLSGNNKAIFTSGTPTCAGCNIVFNSGFNPISTNVNGPTVGTWSSGVSAATQTANVGLTVALPSGYVDNAVYIGSCYVTLNTAATTSSTLPSCTFKWTDFQSSTVNASKTAITWAAGGTGCSGTTTNQAGNSCSGVVVMTVKAATNIQFCTGNTSCDTNGTDYASVGGTAMQYTAFARVTRLN